MKKVLPLVALTAACVALFLLFTPARKARAQQTTTTVYVGDVSGNREWANNGTPNTTVHINITQSSPGLAQYATTQFGTYSNSITLTVPLDASGNGSATYYTKYVQAGQTTESIVSPELGVAANSGTVYNILTPATGVTKIQYQKNGTFVDVPAPLNVLKGDAVTFQAIPSPAGSTFRPIDPSWSGTSGATGMGGPATATFSTLSKNTKDYKTVIATVNNGGGSNTANVIVADGVKSIVFEAIDPSSTIDDNPNTGGGKRIFPDKTNPSDTVNRRKVRVKAQTTFGTGQTIFFKSFDLDDPSSDTAPVDSNGGAGNDNRGGQGTAQQFGILSAVGGTGTTNSASATTDANGLVAVELTVTTQPGDNFMVAASHDSTYLNGLTVSATTLKDSGGVTVGSSTVKAKASPMLTVWRTLHLEIDSMEAVPTTGAQKNSVTGKITSVTATGNIATVVNVDQNLDDGSPKLDNTPNPDNGRFENGRIRIGTTGNVTETADLRGNGTFYVEKDAGSGIVIPCTVSKSGETDVTGNVVSLLNNVFKIGVTGGTLTANFVGGTITVGGMGMTITAVNDTDSTVTVSALADIPIELIDDDAAAMPQLPDTSLMQAKYAPAYILPVVDGGGNSANNKTNVPFILNIQSDSSTALDAELNAPNALESDANRVDNFWIGYMLAAYQGSPYSTILSRGDNDPNGEDALGGVNSGLNGRGGFIFIEEIRDEELEYGITEAAATIPHEIAHQFGIQDCGTVTHQCDNSIHDMMGQFFNQPDSRFSDADLNLLRARIKSPGRQ